jgi:4-amino-4-deoxy-L-arabinose transferase-like glycosyltransferase
MVHNSTYLTTTIDGEAYYNKLPFKFILNALLVKIFGETNFNYRFFDGLCGVAFFILWYFTALKLTKNHFISFVSVIILLGSRELIQKDHGFKYVSNDSFLLLLSLFSLHFAIRIKSHKDYINILAASLSLSFCMLVKTAAAALPLSAIIIWLMLNFKVKEQAFILATILSSAALLFLLALGIYLSFNNLDALTTLFINEIWLRATTGFHNQDKYLFYFELIRKEIAGPFIGVIVGLVYGAINFNNQLALRFSLLWAIFLLLLLSITSSRLDWYMFFVLPPLALLTGSACDFLLHKLEYKQANKDSFKCLYLIFFLFGIYLTGLIIFNFKENLRNSLKPAKANPIERVINENFRSPMHLYADQDLFSTSRLERHYLERYAKDLTYFSDLDKITYRPALVLVSEKLLANSDILKTCNKVEILKKARIRKDKVVVLYCNNSLTFSLP